MVGRVKIHVYNAIKDRWADALVQEHMLQMNVQQLLSLGFRVRVDGEVYEPMGRAAA